MNDSYQRKSVEKYQQLNIFTADVICVNESVEYNGGFISWLTNSWKKWTFTSSYHSFRERIVLIN